MSIRLEGTKEEIAKLERIVQAGLQSQGGQLRSISKFYPNRNTADRMLNRVSETGRVYLELN